jgi:hypothetical protein
MSRQRGFPREKTFKTKQARQTKAKCLSAFDVKNNFVHKYKLEERSVLTPTANAIQLMKLTTQGRAHQEYAEISGCL